MININTMQKLTIISRVEGLILMKADIRFIGDTHVPGAESNTFFHFPLIIFRGYRTLLFLPRIIRHDKNLITEQTMKTTT